ncbi:glycine betaine/L-proline ABC transporter, substrate-binding protein [Escherichia coli]|nr:glycine betaine/L-proline ABC transporter, substrate-binding protein [Escherichia coli]
MRHSVLFATAFATLISTQTFAADLPGKGITVNPVQSTITEETFQTLLVSRALEKLGYTVNKPSEVDYNVGYTSLASGDATFTAVNWTPLHDNMYEAAGGDKKFYREGVFVNGAAQGYLIDKKTADQYKITNIAQLKDPKIAKLFDTNGDGKADLTGCNPGWGCEGAINHQLAAYELTHTVTHNQGNYAAMMADTISRYKEGKPVFYYTWTPYWVSNELKPGKDVSGCRCRSPHCRAIKTPIPNCRMVRIMASRSAPCISLPTKPGPRKTRQQRNCLPLCSCQWQILTPRTPLCMTAKPQKAIFRAMLMAGSKPTSSSSMAG